MKSSPQTQHDGPPAPHRGAGNVSLGCFYRLNGVFAILGSLGVAVIGWIILAQLADNIHKNPDVVGQLPPVAQWCIDHRNWLPLMALAPLAMGIVQACTQRTRSVFWILVAIESIWLAVLVGLILYTFIMFIGPLYQYHPM